MNERNTIYHSFEEQIAMAPNHCAVFDDQRTLSRMELDQLAETMIGKLPKHALRIGVVMDHSVEMIAAIFAVIKMGAAYVPVEPDFPMERIRVMMNDGNVDCIMTHQKYKDRFDGFPLVFVERGLCIDETIESVQPLASPDSLAYILYTSGSTGTPKGVAVENRNVCHYVKAFNNEFNLTDQDIMLQFSVCSFDIFVEEVFASLLNGAVLAIPPKQSKDNLQELMTFVEKHHVTIISGFPYLLQEMNELEVIPASLRLLISGGDVLREGYVDNLVNRVAVYNTYGPSETTVCAAYFSCSGEKALADGTYPIGKPVQGCTIQILDEHMRPVKPGETGEICILGDGISRGYIGERKKENEAFTRMGDGQRVYRSGDLGYILPDGNIAFLYRKDAQVMILGKRVEPDEVESVLCGCPDVKQGVVKPYQDEQSLSYMVAYVVLDGELSSVRELKNQMSRHLPHYMIPEYFVKLSNLPLNANGKVDAGALPVVLKAGHC